MSEQLIAKHPNISMLVNNAGLDHYGLLEDIEPWKLKSIMDTNMMPHVILSKYFAMYFRIREHPRSCIINNTSVASTGATPNFLTYSCTKVFLDFVTRAFNFE